MCFQFGVRFYRTTSLHYYTPPPRSRAVAATVATQNSTRTKEGAPITRRAAEVPSPTYTMPDVPEGGAGGVGGKQLLSAYPAFGSAALMTQDWHVPGSCVTAFALHAALSAPHPLRRLGE